jgi:hypothetical protein
VARIGKKTTEAPAHDIVTGAWVKTQEMTISIIFTMTR